MLIIAEKPSLAEAIAKAIASRYTRHTKGSVGYIEAGEHQVTWCLGHVLELAPPHHYDSRLKSWSLDQLPILIRPDAWALLPKDDAKAQLAVIEALLKKAREVVNAGDPDREGQMLVDEVLEHFRWEGATQRLLVHDTTAASVRKSFAKMRPNVEYLPLYQAAKCRSRADWLVGMNLSRAATKRIGPKISVGRVQTPTLALVVRRDREIEGHAAKHFYALHATCCTRNETVVLSHDNEKQRIFDESEAKRLAGALQGKTVSIAVEEHVETERSPMPFMLATFQRAAEELYGWGVKECQSILQSLYEAELVSYPRTDHDHLPAEQEGEALPMAKAILSAGLLPDVAPLLSQMRTKKRVYGTGKTEEHHGLTPTRKLPPPDLPPKLRNGWELVARRFLASLCPDYQATIKVASFEFQGRVFSAKGAAPINLEASWRRVIPKKELPEALPIAAGGGETVSALARSVEIKKGKTTPPKAYTESTLIADMRAVAKYVTNEQLRAKLKETAGIGTAATQATTIETLKERGYVTLEGKGKVKRLRSTPLGRYVIDALPPVLADPGVTALWENQLDLIAQKAANDADFMEKIAVYVTKHVQGIKTKEMPPLPPEVKDKPAPTAKARAHGRRVLGKKRRYS